MIYILNEQKHWDLRPVWLLYSHVLPGHAQQSQRHSVIMNMMKVMTTNIMRSDPQSKNAVSTIIKHSRYTHLMSNFSSIHFHAKRLYVHLFDILVVDTPFMEEDWSSANFFRNFPRQKKVLCKWSKMQILRFYFNGAEILNNITLLFLAGVLFHFTLLLRVSNS